MEQPIYVARSSMPPLEEYVEEIRPLWDTHMLTNMGAKHQALEAALAQYLEVENLSLFVNGHLALEMVLQAMQLKGEVITTPFTFISTTHAILRNGLTPVFCDIREDDFTIDASKLESLITESTAAILPVHVYGNLCEIERIEAIAKKHHLPVIYDAAHAFGVRYRDQGAGSFGDVSMFSFHATKVFNTIEGGAVCFRDAALKERLHQLKNFGIQGPEEVVAVGGNAKMNEFQAAMGLCNLRHLDAEIERRRAVFKRYCSALENVPGLRLPHLQKDTQPNYAYYPILVQDAFGASRDEVFDALAKNNIHARKYFYPPTNEHPCVQERLTAPAATPVAAGISRQVLTLPIYADLPLAEVDRIAATVRSARV